MALEHKGLEWQRHLRHLSSGFRHLHLRLGSTLQGFPQPETFGPPGADVTHQEHSLGQGGPMYSTADGHNLRIAICESPGWYKFCNLGTLGILLGAMAYGDGGISSWSLQLGSGLALPPSDGFQ